MHRLRSCVLAVIALLSLAAPAAYAWPHSPIANVPVSPFGSGSSPCTVADGAGGFFVAYADYRNGNADVIVQHYDGGGNPLWAPNGVVLCNAFAPQSPIAIVADGSGGVVVVWVDYRADFTYGDLYAGRVSAAGVSQWSPNGEVVCTAPLYTTSVKVAADLQGGVYVAWEDFRDQGTNQRDIYLQHVTYWGAPALGANGLALSSLTSDASQPALAVSPGGDAFVVWSDGRSDSDIYGQYVSYSGVPNLAPDGAPICTATYYQSEPQVEALPNSNFLVTWSDLRSLADYDVYAQTVVGYSGAPLLAANGVPVCTTPGNQILLDMVADGTGGYVLLWNAQSPSNSNLQVQKLNAVGMTQWTAAGVPVTTTGSYYFFARLTADGMGGTLAAWTDSRGDGDDVYAQRLHNDGTSAWQASGVRVCTADRQQYLKGLAPLTNGGALLAWDDYRVTAPAAGARMQAVDEWGYLGADPIMADVRDIPNDQGGQVKVTWAASPLDYDPAFRNITAYTVFRSVPQRLVSGLSGASRSSADDGRFTARDGRTFRRMRFGTMDYYWEELARITPRHLTAYSYVAATEGDSVGGSDPVTVFMIGAETANGASFWFSQPDSGHSVDNLPPAAPAPLTGQYLAGSTRLHWNPNTEADIAGYRVYRGTTLGFATGPATLVAAVPDTGYTDPSGAPYYYKLTAIDSHGNESPVATLQPTGTLDAGDAPRASFFLAGAAPNPAPRGRDAVLRFGLARSGRAELVVMDAAGRRVRTLVAGELPAGEQSVRWDARDDAGARVHAGLYFVRLQAGGASARQRVVVIE